MQKLEEKALKKKVKDWENSFSAKDKPSVSPCLSANSRLA